MLETIFFGGAVYLLVLRLRGLADPKRAQQLAQRPMDTQLAKLLEYANRLYQERRLLQAEKVYLKVLHIERTNSLAYSRLGMIYIAQKNYRGAIESFQMAAEYDPNAATFYNLGLAYLENRNYVKAIAAFEKSIMFEPAAIRYIGLAKAYHRVSNHTQVIFALEKAVEMDPSKRNLQLLAEAYITGKERAKAEDIYRRILKIDPTDAKAAKIVGGDGQ